MKLLSVILIFAVCWLLNIYSGYLWVHHCWRLIAEVCANISLYPFTILLYHISNADIVWQEKHYYSSYIMVGRCPWSAILIVYLVNYCKPTYFVNDLTGCKIMLDCMASHYKQYQCTVPLVIYNILVTSYS